jgi:histidinol-phosphatase
MRALSTGNLKSLARGPRWAALGEVIGEVGRIRGYGDFLHYHLLARGGIDAVIESDVNILDIAALAVIVREAGGVFTDLDGAAPGPLHPQRAGRRAGLPRAAPAAIRGLARCLSCRRSTAWKSSTSAAASRSSGSTSSSPTASSASTSA